MGGGQTRRSKWFGVYWCVGDPCGIVCAAFTWFLLFYAQFCVLSVFLVYITERPIHTLCNAAIFELIFGLALSSHVKTMFTDPGAVPKYTLTDDYLAQVQIDQQLLGGVVYRCTKCMSAKPERAHHCSICKRCIRRMDHHCPWVNNCVGEKNQKAFVLFTFYISMLSCHTLYWATTHFVWCVGTDWYQCSYFEPPATTILLIFLLFEAILFAIFTAVMFGTQLSSICSDQTGIESLKAEQHSYHRAGNDAEDLEAQETRKPGSSWKNVRAVFGGGRPFSLSWFNPFVIPFITEKAFLRNL